MFNELSIQDRIQIIAIISSTLVGLLSIIIAILALRQTSKSIREANKPYITAYLESITVTDTRVQYLVLKNFGKTGALIKSVTVFPIYEPHIGDGQPFQNFNDVSIAPNQSFSHPVRIFYSQQDPEKLNRQIKISYEFNRKSYCETIEINEVAIAELAITKTSPSKSVTLEKVVSRAVQELIRHNL